ncbi:MAG: (2Fe-2S)-binding protein [Vicinamibacterales bacterium]|jgi:carbon-monoxide dehydrogenase small subunit|nr:4-hydroxybenzoyl-CoA reductase subunit gamma [Acidobacteriota bacterium]MDP7295035.1 (2Fe-2S)-binding protein [Vicinamibacterales bacterium]MDP7470928.1 (2Fe-2S)-binding protein [Vicinamibacterales bacterium]MDP7670545.1 (2Fe-2S)-binding protein [Vicinamibacterales bacterium]HJO38202.1 (2Fe-2S)-binding protein [Vicinamibacterales bacterium]
MNVECTLEVNGSSTTLQVAPSARLIDVLREDLGLTGTKEGCGNGECGSCTVLLDGRPVNACLLVALEVEGRAVTTIEGLLGPGGKLSHVQQAFVETGGIQCGFCTPGMIMSATALLEATPAPSDAEIRDALVGNLCRCTGYAQIIESVRAAAELIGPGSGGETPR